MTPRVSETYYIDGYNLLHYVPRWKELAECDLEEARRALVIEVGKWCAATDHTAKIIFDGTGARTEVSEQAGQVWGVEVLYTSRHTSADAIIERGVYDAPQRESIVVVSADRGILDLCRGMGAMSMRPEYFLRTMSDTIGETMARILNARSTKKLGTVEDLLDEADREDLKKLGEGLKD